MRKYFDSIATHNRGSKVNRFPEYVLSSVNHVKCNRIQSKYFKKSKDDGKDCTQMKKMISNEYQKRKLPAISNVFISAFQAHEHRLCIQQLIEGISPRFD